MAVAAKWSRAAFSSGLIEFVCYAHGPAEEGPTITPQYGSWTYCASSAASGHDWRQIEPVSRERLERYILPKRLKRRTR